MRLPKIGSMIGSLRNWYKSHLKLVLVLYLLALIPLTLLFGAIFLYEDRGFSQGTTAIAWYFYFWITFYWFVSILTSIFQKSTDDMVKREKLRAMMMQTRAVSRALRRSQEMTIPLKEKHA